MKILATTLNLWLGGGKLPNEHLIIKHGETLYKKFVLHPLKRRLAKYYLIFLKLFFGTKVIGITGSAGKTTTKEMLASILSLEEETVATDANIDPVYNIPTTILKCGPSTKFLVLEMGVEYPGEMDFYLWLAKPDIGVITNISATHTLYFGDVKGVLKEKSKLVKSLSKNDFAILNSEDKSTELIKKKTKAKLVFFGENGEIKVKNISLDLSGTKFTLISNNDEIPVKIPIIGRQFVNNALAASAVAFALGITFSSIKKGLQSFKPAKHRMKVFVGTKRSLIIDDSYNNNPAAAREALKTFIQIAAKKRKILVFGDMLELGKNEKRYHAEIGRTILDLNLDNLICVGELSKETCKIAAKGVTGKAFWAKDWRQAYKFLLPLLDRNNTVLIKGSRSLGLDQLVSRLSLSAF